MTGSRRRRAPTGRLTLGTLLVAGVVGVAGLWGAPAALADSSQSTNWAGYAVHRSGVSFDRVLGTWIQPAPVCAPGQATYSSLWVGIGGYSTSATALEQIGTEADCATTGTPQASAWYELVPAASRTIALKISAGDRIRASVAVHGALVTLTLADLTTGRSFQRTIHATTLDTSSAEWIVEAPSECSVAGDCRTLPLAAFGSAAFTGASAQSSSGQRGAISDRHWTASRISLVGSGRQFIGGPPGAATPAVTAVTAPLTAAGSAFTVTYRGASASGPVASLRLVRPGRLSHTP